jgi:LPS export ABC transporter protein LptC
MRPAAARTSTAGQRLITLAAILAGLVLLYGLLVDRSGDEPGPAGATEQRGYYVDDATLTETGADGKPRIVVQAKTIEQQLSDDSVLLTDLKLDYTAANRGNWRITANHGRMPPDRSSLLLDGDVTVTGKSERGSPVIVTDQLTYDTNSDYIQTAERVNIRFGNNVLIGRGLRVNLNAETLRLESNVNGRFVP